MHICFSYLSCHLSVYFLLPCMSDIFLLQTLQDEGTTILHIIRNCLPSDSVKSQENGILKSCLFKNFEIKKSFFKCAFYCVKKIWRPCKTMILCVCVYMRNSYEHYATGAFTVCKNRMVDVEIWMGE